MNINLISNDMENIWPSHWEIILGKNLLQFIEKGMREGTSYITTQYPKANNNNLYSWAMSQYFPTGGFRWLTNKEITKLDIAKYKDNSKQGFILEVNLEYPISLHNIHNDYPLGPEKINVNENMS